MYKKLVDKCAKNDAWADGIMWFGIVGVVLIGFAGTKNFVHSVGAFMVIYGSCLLVREL